MTPLGPFLLYFLRLGALGFGGPIALAGAMQRDLVEKRGWIAREDYLEGLALAQMAPGPLAAQLAIYLGWVRARLVGATLVALAFVGPSFVMVLILSVLYVRFGGLSWMQGAFYGIGAAVIAVIARSAWKLVKLSVGRDPLLALLFLASGIVTAWTERELVLLFVASGVIAMVVKARPRALHSLAPVWLVPLYTGWHGPASLSTLATLGWFFAAAGAVVFGSGLAIVPFLHGGVVVKYGWLNERQFLDAVAVAMITPGPVVITVAFIGYLVAGLAGATVAALGVFVPCFLVVVIAAPYYRKFGASPLVKAFVAGVTAAAAGAIAGAAVVLGRRAIVDLPTAAIALAALVLLTLTKRVPEPVLILVSGGIGLLLSRH